MAQKLHTPGATMALTTPAPTAAVSAWEEADIPEDLTENEPSAFPSLRIIQKAVEDIPNSGRHGGDYWRTDLEQFVERPTGTFVAYQSTRALFQKLGVGDGKPICRSEDAIRPAPGQPVWMMERITLRDQGEIAGGAVFDEPTSCAACPFQKAGCKFSYAAYLLDDEGYLLRMRFKGTGVMPFSSFIRTLRPKTLRVGGGARGLPIFSRRVELSAVCRAKDDFTWFEPVITVLGENPISEVQRLVEVAREVRTRIARGVEPVVEEESEDHAADGGWDDGSTPALRDVPIE